jgi:hypothetical protein
MKREGNYPPVNVLEKAKVAEIVVHRLAANVARRREQSTSYALGRDLPLCKLHEARAKFKEHAVAQRVVICDAAKRCPPRPNPVLTLDLAQTTAELNKTSIYVHSISHRVDLHLDQICPGQRL